ncbi:hypothetical protein GCM10011591_41660 [Nocardia camponoti]|uniref:Uncharacterized protein n=1 Tax=Nocardia camponoti TaxID=1616106 RepID=A0A917QSF2_9NOCA|nr:hypothetical protein GCM10011591_41660 [Nocardia camponoti]
MNGFVGQPSPPHPAASRGPTVGRVIDIIITSLLYVLVPGTLFLLTAFSAGWVLAAADTCQANPPCSANPELGMWIVGGGWIGSVVAASLITYASIRHRIPLWIGAVLCCAGLVVSWLAGVRMILGW